jgi:small neutral amino acid transporter SnatA (MarC family)
MSLWTVLIAVLLFWFLFIVGGLFVLFMWAIWVPLGVIFGLIWLFLLALAVVNALQQAGLIKSTRQKQPQ